MTIIRSKQFNKDHKKLPWFIREKFYERLDLFLVAPTDPLLHTHKLQGVYQNYMSINITGDYRLILEQLPQGNLGLIRIGTHSQLYKK